MSKHSKINIDVFRDSLSIEGYILISDSYKDNKTKITCSCPKGHTYETTWFNWNTNKSRCPECNGGKTLHSDFIEHVITSEGYTLLDVYKNSKIGLNMLCDKNHDCTISYEMWKQGVRCKVCSDIKRRTDIFNIINKAFEYEKYTLLSNEYISVEHKLKFKCPKGHLSDISWHSWKKGHRCRKCADVDKLDFDVISEHINSEGYTVVDTIYINCRTKLRLICPNGHEYNVSWDHFRSKGSRCPECSKADIMVIKELFEKDCYTLLSDEYINNKTKLKYICPKGHHHGIRLNDWQQGHRCPTCAGQTKPTIEEISVSFTKEGYILLSSEYNNRSTKLRYMCPYKHEHEISWSNWNNGHRCPECNVVNIMGSGNPSWKGGISNDGYCPLWKDVEYKKDIRDRDDNRCLNPYCHSPNSRDLTIHHIDYDKKNCSPKNLITVCRSCNSKANTDREWHKGWYSAIMNQRGL